VAYANSGTLERNRAVWQQVAEARHQKAQPQGRAGRSGAEKRVRLASVGRDANGLPARLDSHRWPAGQGAKQHDYEPPRLSATCEKPRLKALGNAVVPQVVYPIAVAIREYLEAQDAGEA
jgi:DNA (cytosine-5)-methyltransferase 1